MSGRGRGRGGRGDGGRGSGRGSGRGGEYYRNKYGGGGRGRGGRGDGFVVSSNGSNAGGDEINKSVGGGGGGGSGVSSQPQAFDTKGPGEMKSVGGGGSFQSQSFDANIPRLGGDNGGEHSALVELLRRLDGKQYPAYHGIESSTKGWVNVIGGYSLYIARAQSDPFAKPTRCRVIVKDATARFPPVSYQNKIRSVALGDYLNRVLYENCKNMGADVGAEEKGHGGGRHGGWGGSKGGDIEVRNDCIMSYNIFLFHYHFFNSMHSFLVRFTDCETHPTRH